MLCSCFASDFLQARFLWVWVRDHPRGLVFSVGLSARITIRNDPTDSNGLRTHSISIVPNYLFTNIHLIHKILSSELLHCALMHAQTATHHGYNEVVYCCMPRPQSIVVHIASMAGTRMSLSHSRHLQCYLKIRYIHGALRSGYATMRNAQCAMQQLRKQPFF